MRTLRLIDMLVREWLSRDGMERCPEPTNLMDDIGNVEAFHAQGATALTPVYEFNAGHIGRLAPTGATVVDLGSGSAQFLCFLAERRPDLRIIGIELAPTMVDVGRRLIRERSLEARVDLRQGDMTRFADTLGTTVQVVSSVFSLHHLPTTALLGACVAEMATLHRRDGASIWVFDHARPLRRATADVFPDLFTPQAAPEFKQDSTNSLRAAFSFRELGAAFDAHALLQGRHWLSRVMRLYQVHEFQGSAAAAAMAGAWRASSLEPQAARDLDGLRWLFPGLEKPAS